MFQSILAKDNVWYNSSAGHDPSPDYVPELELPRSPRLYTYHQTRAVDREPGNPLLPENRFRLPISSTKPTMQSIFSYACKRLVSV